MIDFQLKDCIEGMSEYPENYFNLAIVDPPYGLDKKLKGGNTGFSGTSLNNLVEKKWDVLPDKKFFDELFRVSKNQIIWGANYFIEYLRNTQCVIYWDKMNGTNSLSDFELAWTSFNRGSKRFCMHHFSKGYDKKIHPTQKPVNLYKWLLSNFAKKGDLILDTHVGSASSLIACKDMGFDCVGFEIDEEYFSIANQRLKDFESQLNLFDLMDK
jgi:site-specific DNA-methyltransferase (adenine-specific)